MILLTSQVVKEQEWQHQQQQQQRQHNQQQQRQHNQQQQQQHHQQQPRQHHQQQQQQHHLSNYQQPSRQLHQSSSRQPNQSHQPSSSGSGNGIFINHFDNLLNKNFKFKVQCLYYQDHWLIYCKEISPKYRGHCIRC